MMGQNTVANVLMGLLSEDMRESRGIGLALMDQPAAQAAVDAIKKRDPLTFDHEFAYKLSQAVEGVLEVAAPGSYRAHFLFSHYGFVSSHFSKQLDKYETNPGCPDKTATILHKLAKYLLDGTEMSFEKGERHKNWEPQTIFTMHDEVINFFGALIDLHIGKPERYLEELAKLEAFKK